MCGRGHACVSPSSPQTPCNRLPPCCMQAPGFLWSTEDQLESELAEGPPCVWHCASVFYIPAHVDPHKVPATSDAVFGQSRGATKLGCRLS